MTSGTRTQACFGALLLLLLTACRSSVAPPPKNDSLRTPFGTSDTVFMVRTREAGLDYVFEKWWKEPGNIRETIGNGCAFLDYDGDGNLDILLVGKPTALYRGDGAGHFRDVSQQTGIATLTDRFIGCAMGDIDNDGYPDIYLSAYQGGKLLHNVSGGHFEDVTARFGIPEQPFGTSCCFFDANNDGLLDLFIGNYVVFGPKVQPQLCPENGLQTSCGPRFYKPEFGTVLLNVGGKRFQRASSRLLPQTAGKVLGVATGRMSETHRPLLAIANDERPGDLLMPVKDGYENQGESSGTAFDNRGNLHGGMGVDWGDVDNDGQLDLFVTTFNDEAKALYKNDNGLFQEISAERGLAPLNPLVSFGAKFLDYDNDGLLDLIVASGHIQDNIHKIDPLQHYRQPITLLHHQGTTGFMDASSALSEEARRPIVGRGLAIGDYDNDGRIDVLVVDSEGKPLLLHNEIPKRNHYLGLRLIDKHGRDAYNALVTVEAAGKTQVRLCTATGSFLSSSDPRVLVGLGPTATVARVTVQWPDGETTAVEQLPVDRYTTMHQQRQTAHSTL